MTACPACKSEDVRVGPPARLGGWFCDCGRRLFIMVNWRRNIAPTVEECYKVSREFDCPHQGRQVVARFKRLAPPIEDDRLDKEEATA